MRAYERLLKYVKVHTTSDPNSGTHPSTLRQFDLAKILVEELKELGLADAHVDEHCYVYATLPATPGQESAKPLGFIAHMDTADDASGENVQPQIHENYDGEAVTLPATGTVLDPGVPVPQGDEGPDSNHHRTVHAAGCGRQGRCRRNYDRA